MDGLDKLTTDDRFELLSAYVDDELSVSERKRVEAWLESDPEMKRQYRALSAISRSFQSMPAPQSASSADDVLDAVFTQVDRKPRLLKMAGITTAIVASMGALGALLGGPLLSPRIANDAPSKEVPSQATSPIPSGTVGSDLDAVDTGSLMLVLEAPPVDIPIVSESNSLLDSTGQE